MSVRIAIVLLAGTATAAASPCPVFGLEPVVLSPASSTIPADGGVLVGTRVHTGGDVGKGEIAVQPDWTFRAGKTAAKPVTQVIAPGLAVYRLPTGVTDAVLDDGKGKSLAKLHVGAAGAALPAPRVTAIVSGTTKARHPNTFVTVEIDGSPPAGAVALVVGDGGATGRSWGLVDGAESHITVYSTNSGCGGQPAGTVFSGVGDRVLAFWVDAAGRRSPATPKITVTAP